MSTNKKKMSSSQSSVLAKNTLFLYVRLLFNMLISLYSSRLILNLLGVEDYGIYNAVGGMVSMFSIISGSLSTSISRNLTFELGAKNYLKLGKIFSMSINVQILIVALIALLAETIGLWFLNAKMVIPSDRMTAANWIFQFSLATFAIQLLSVPYNASIISHERMKAFAYIGIFDVVLKLIAVILLVWSPVDKLVYYGALLLGESLVIQGIYIIYCKKNFDECIYHFTKDLTILKSLFSFAAWNFIGSTSSILREQGVNILLNLFFGPVVNAARAVASQVNAAVNSFVTNFMTALTPQITKAYAHGDYKYLLQCIYRGSKFSYFLLFFLSLPVLIETDYILKLWLGNVPDTTVWFVRLILLFSLVDTYSRALINANNATGDIKIYQIVIGGLNLTVLPIAYVALKYGARAESTVFITIIVSLLGLFPRIYFNKKHFPVTYKDFIAKVIIPTVFVSVVGVILPYTIYRILPQNFFSFLLVVLMSFLSAIIAIIVLGVNKEERNIAISFIRKYLHNKKS